MKLLRSAVASVGAVALALAPAACDRSEAPATAGSLRVALLLAGPENDEGWNQSAYEGLSRIQKELGADVRKVTAREPATITRAFELAAEQGFRFLYGHGVEFNAPAAEVAARFPGVFFATSGGTASAPNLASITPRTEEAAWQLGILAAHLTKSGVLSSLHGEKFDAVERAARAFAGGARSVKGDVKILEDYLGSWEDAALAKERALAHAAAGADLFFQNADAAGAGIFEACREKHALAFGCNRDQAGKAPDVIVASAVSDIPELLLGLATEVRDGKFAGGARSFGIKEGKVRVVFNPALEAKLPAAAIAAAKTAMNAAASAIMKGELDVAAR